MNQSRIEPSLLFRQILGEAVDFCIGESNQLTERVKSDMYQSADHSMRADEQNLLWTAYQGLLKRHRDFVSILQRTLPHALSVSVTAEGMNNRDYVKSQPLGLIETADVEREVLILNAIRRLEDLCGETLAPFTHRVCVLRGLSTVSINANPLRPEVFMRGFVDAWEEFDGNRLSTRAMLRALQMNNFLPLNALFVQLNGMLIKNGVLPNERYIIKRESATKALWQRSSEPGEGADLIEQRQKASIAALGSLSSAGIRATDADWQFDPERFMRQLGMLLEQFGNLAAVDTPVEGEAAVMPAAAPNQALIAHLQSMQIGQLPVAWASRNPTPELLEQIGNSEQARSSSEIDRATIEMLSRMFGFVLKDPVIPAEIKALLALLQVPVLKAALLDREFFLRDEHPARRLVDLLAKAAVYWEPSAGSDDPVYRQIDAVVQRVVSEFTDEHNLFDVVCEEFQLWVDAREQDYERSIEEKVKAAAEQEALSYATQEVGKRILRRFELAPIDETMGGFLNDHWHQVLVRYFIVRDEQPEEWSRMLEAMDVLIWSVMPKINSIERNELIRSLPSLLKRVNFGLDLIDWHGPERDQFMQYLMDSHAKVVRTPVPQAPAGAKLSAPPRLAQDSQITEINAGSNATVIDQSYALERNDWVVLDLGTEIALRYRLSWISPMRTKYVFTHLDGEKWIIKNETEVIEMLQTGILRKIDTSPMMQRAIAATLMA